MGVASFWAGVRMPTRGTFPGCCAIAGIETDPAAAAPPRSVMKSRRLMCFPQDEDHTACDANIACFARWRPGAGLLMAHRVESLRCEGSDAIGAKRTCRERRERVDLTKMTPMYGPAVRCKRVSSIWRTCGLASMYPASDWSVLCSEPSWISARVRSY